MKHISMLILALGLLASPTVAQANFPAGTEKFADRASETTDISLDKSMLAFASKFLSSSPQDVEARRIIATLDGIYVRSFEFEKPGVYSSAELEAIRRQFAGSEWSHIVSVRSKTSDGDTDIF